MKKVYLAHPISTTGEFNDSIRVAERINHIYIYDENSEKNMPKYDVYAPALNKAINDKSNNPTPQMIYEQDVERLLDSDIVVINYTGGDADGTVLELGLLAGMYEYMAYKKSRTTVISGSYESPNNLPAVYVYSSNKRALQPQLHNGIASGKLNHMVLGAIDKYFTWCENEDDMVAKLSQL